MSEISFSVSTLKGGGGDLVICLCMYVLCMYVCVCLHEYVHHMCSRAQGSQRRASHHPRPEIGTKPRSSIRDLALNS